MLAKTAISAHALPTKRQLAAKQAAKAEVASRQASRASGTGSGLGVQGPGSGVAEAAQSSRAGRDFGGHAGSPSADVMRSTRLAAAVLDPSMHMHAQGPSGSP